MAAWLLMAASGFSGLALQIAWTQQAAVWLGHESAAVLGVVAAFFGGLSIGALVLGPRIARSARPRAWYVGCEWAIAGWGIVLIVAMSPASGLMLDLTGLQPSPVWQWAMAFLGTFALLLPATAAMGATLPAMERLLARDTPGGRTVAGLYAANTGGAVLGVLASAFLLVPAWGLSATAGLAVSLNTLCALAATWVWREGGGAARAEAVEPPPGPGPAAGHMTPGLPLRLAATGCLGIGYELVVVRALRQVTENTVYTFALLLAVYLVGTALGAAWWQRRASRGAGLEEASDRLLLALAATTGVGGACLWALLPLHAALLSGFGPGYGAALAAEATLAAIVFLPATLCMGALFSLLSTQALQAGLGLGRALGINTLGAATAAPLIGVGLAPLWGLKPVLVTLAAGYLLLRSRQAWRGPGGWAVAGGLVSLAVFAPPLVNVTLPEGARLLSHAEGALGAVSVIESAHGERTLHIDNRQQEGSSATGYSDGRQALLPLLLHPQPRRALLLGLGTGATAAAAASDRAVQVEVVELLPEVVKASGLFAPAADPATAPGPRPLVRVADARRFVRASTEAYDLVVSDNFHPARSGSAALYTVEHFRAVQRRLADGGVFCQWLPLHQMDLATLKSIVRSFMTVYPQGWALLATNSLDTPVIGLVARQGGAPLRLHEARQRLGASTLMPSPVAYGLDSEWALLGSAVADAAALVRWSADAPVNTDDRPVVAALAPRLTYAPDSRPRERLLQWLDELSAAAAASAGARADAWDGALEPRDRDRLRAYRAARDQYLRAGRDVVPSRDVQLMLRQVEAPLLRVLQTSPDFRPAYEPLVQMAVALAPEAPARAVALLKTLEQLQPAWPEARQALQSLPSPTSSPRP